MCLSLSIWFLKLVCSVRDTVSPEEDKLILEFMISTVTRAVNQNLFLLSTCEGSRVCVLAGFINLKQGPKKELTEVGFEPTPPKRPEP